MLEQLRSRIQALEYDNDRLRNLAEVESISPNKDEPLEVSSSDHNEALARIESLEELLQATHLKLEASEASQIQAGDKHQEDVAALEAGKASLLTDFKSLEEKLKEQTTLVGVLEQKLAENNSRSHQLELEAQGRDEEIKTLDNKLQTLLLQFEDERQDLASQVSRLRQAGQVCAFPKPQSLCELNHIATRKPLLSMRNV
jgi:chromosome segregation ATPase